MKVLTTHVGSLPGPPGFDPSSQRFCLVRIDALNYALRNIPEERVRYHLCWGSWHGPHAHDLPLADIVDVMLRVPARTDQGPSTKDQGPD